MSSFQHDLREQLVEAMISGQLSRREFLRRASVLGLALGASTSLAGLGSRAFVGTARAQSGGTLRVGFVTPGKSIDPLRVNNEGGVIALDQAGEYLIWSNSSLQLEPRVAESWEPSEGGAVWTFKIRQGVKFHDGTPLTAKDVVATMQMHADEANGSNALSVFKGVLTPDGIRAVDDNTVGIQDRYPERQFPLPTTRIPWSCREDVFGEFKESHPDFEVEVAFVDVPDVASSFVQALEVDQAPDFFYAFESQGTLSYLNHLHDLTGVVEDAGLTDDFYENAKALWTTADGKLVGIPMYYGTKCYVYRADIWDEAGLDPDSLPHHLGGICRGCRQTDLKGCFGRQHPRRLSYV